MTGGSRRYVLDISESLFHLTTETVRLHSNETGRHQTLASFVNRTIASGCCPLDDHPAATLRDHLAAVPTKGDIRISLKITEANAESLSNVRDRIGETLGASVSVADTLSLLLFRYVAERNAELILQRIGFDKVRNGQSLDNNQRRQNVVPIGRVPLRPDPVKE